jgi:hypothetical protein
VANNPFFSDTSETAVVNTRTALCNSGTFNIYSGSQPADANTAIGAQVLLVTLTFGPTAFGGAVASGSAGSRIITATANAITPGTAVANGTAAWFRVLKSDATTVVFDGSVGTSGCDLNISNTAITIGAVVSISSFTITQPE